MDVKIVRKQVTVNKDGLTRHYTNYFLVLPNGAYLAIKPAFENDYKTLYILADELQQKG